MNREEVVKKIKEIIVSSLELEDVSANEIDEVSPLFGDGLGLDSIDALELGMAIRKAFNVTFSKDPAVNKKVFYSVDSLANHVLSMNENDK